MRVAGKVVVVTGAGSGIGAALSSRFCREGASAVVVADIDERWLLDPDKLKSKCKNTPFDEARLQGRVLRTIVAGRTVFEYAA